MKIKLFLIFLLTIPTIMALNVEPSSQSIELFTDNAENVFFNITNDGQEEIYYLTLSSDNEDITFIDNQINLSINETRTIKLLIDTYQSYQETAKINLVYYLMSNVVNTPTQETVSITATGYNPDNLEVFSESTITWINNDTIKHSITSALFDEDLEPGESFPYTYTTIGINQYYDKFTSLQGQVVVKDIIGQGYVHNPQHDQEFNLEIRSKLVETQIKIEFLEKSSFNISVNNREEAVLMIENIGDKTAERVILTSDPNWISFGLNEIYIEKNKKKYIPYTVNPIVSTSSETDKTHQIEIFARGENTFDTNNTISVFIPYKEGVSLNDTAQALFNQTINEDFLIAMHNLVCQSNPDYVYCKPKVVEKIVYQSKPLPYNHTQEDIQRMLRQQEDLNSKIERSLNTYHSEIETIKTSSETASKNSAETKILTEKLQEEYEKSQKSESTAYVVLIVLMILLFLAIIGYFGVKILLDWIKETNATKA